MANNKELNYKDGYLTLFHGISECIEFLQDLQKAGEQIVISEDKKEK